MPVSVTMPRLGESVSEGTVTRWLKQEGEHVEADEPLLEVSTDKVDTEIPSPSSGVLTSIKVGEDETVDVGVELAVISESADAAAPAPEASAPEPPAAPATPAPAAPAAAPAPAETPAAQAEPTAADEAPVEAAAQAPAAPPAPAPAAATAPVNSGDDDGGPYVTPLVRRLAAEHDVDLSALRGTGVGGRIRKQDVLDAARNGSGSYAEASSASAPTPTIAQPAPPAAASPPSAPPAPVKASQPAAAAAATLVRGRTEKLSRLRSVIATRMVESLQISAQLTTVVEVDITRIARLRDRAKASFEAREGVKLTFLPFFAVATCEALKLHPKLNASIDQAAGTVTYHDVEHLGIAVDTDRGLLAPVIHGAGDLNLGGMARQIADLADRTRRNAVTPDELGGGTFTLTNTGSRGALFDTPIIFQPQVGILGTGTVVKRPAVVEDPELGEIVAIRSIVYLALSYDHRLVDGADAARFLTTIKERLEEGAFDADLGF
ncbi:MAG TPA: 2-oxoglutarate dehydrogenase, E2 component, dihydrolipoamide succinyltransferase [Frankiaceae bacterium]|nr:2-oxoglutarate dehydrogenase, E2 component, dihydrolipoamide succinyltransferase [Frankiaceae bacterium]